MKTTVSSSRSVTERVWSRLDCPGHEVFRLDSTTAGWTLSGVAIGLAEHGSYAMEYKVHCDPSWRGVDVAITGWSDRKRVDISLARVDHAGWLMDGAECPELAGCTDIDLSFSPSTNTSAIRRLDLAIGQSGVTSAAWLTFPALRLERLDQEYQRTAKNVYRYSAPELAFTADLEVDEHGVVVSYPGLWRSSAREIGEPPRAGV